MLNSHNDNIKNPIFTGALLVGGHSRRMGRDKAMIVHRGRPLWLHSHEVLAAVCGKLLIAGDRPDLASESLPCFADAFPGSALAGLHTALTHAATEWVMTLPCDLPYPSLALSRRLQDARSDDVDAVIPRTRLGCEPLIACYRKSCLPSIIRRLASGQPKIHDLLDELAVRYLDEPELPSGWRRALRNLNTPSDLARLQQPPPALSFIANSGTGKTTLLEKVIGGLTGNGWRVGALKHDAHRFEIDHPGKDSWRLTQAGAAVTAISSPARTAVIRHHEKVPALDELLRPFADEVDIVLTEGFRKSDLPKVEVHRAELLRALLSRNGPPDPTLIAVATDSVLDVDVPQFDLDEPGALVAFIEETFLT